MRSPLLSPAWLVGHVLVAAVLIAFPLLGLWQLDRHEQRQATDAALEQRPEQPALSAGELDGDPEELAYRRVALTGTWEPAGEVLLSTRPHQGRPGHHVLTPLRLEDGSAVLVDRGWVPYETEGVPVDAAAPPDGPTEVTGLALPAEPAHRAGVLGGDGHDPEALAPGEPVEFVSHADPAVVGRAIGEDLPSLVVRADGGHRRADADLPATVPPPEPEEGGVDHFSYAMQWFAFTGVVAVGYPVLLRRRHREGRGGADAGADGPGADDADGAPGEAGEPVADGPSRVP